MFLLICAACHRVGLLMAGNYPKSQSAARCPVLYIQSLDDKSWIITNMRFSVTAGHLISCCQTETTGLRLNDIVDWHHWSEHTLDLYWGTIKPNWSPLFFSLDLLTHVLLPALCLKLRTNPSCRFVLFCGVNITGSIRVVKESPFY